MGTERILRHHDPPAQLKTVAILTALLASACSADDHISSDAAADAPLHDSGVDATFERQPFPQIPNVGNRTLTSPTLVTIVASNDNLAAQLDGFSDSVPQSSFWTSMAGEYGLGTITSAAHLVGPALGTGTYSTAQLSSYVTNALGGADAGFAPNGDTIYLLYLPPGATYSGTFAQDCGYHTSYPPGVSTGDQLATVIRCNPFPDQETVLDGMTRVAAHEIAESATDPLGKGYNLGQTSLTPWTSSIWAGWVGAGLIEVGDLCEGTRIIAGGWEYQRIWSNMSAAAGGDPCEPTLPIPYYSVTTPQAWYAGAASTLNTIPIEGWATATTSNWLLQINVVLVKGGFQQLSSANVAIETDLGVGSSGMCATRQAMNAGHTGTIRVPVPSGVASGDYVVLQIYSFRESGTCYPPLTEDDYHFWLVGIYIP